MSVEYFANVSKLFSMQRRLEPSISPISLVNSKLENTDKTTLKIKNFG